MIMSYYLWELEAVLEGLALRELDKQEQNAIFGFNLRYILNAKKPQLNKVINKQKAENKIKKRFNRTQKKLVRSNKRLEKALKALEHFKNRG
ncbi:hypothetical protein [Enterococcus mediterraneensis]|uniref:hypothetical protein n=1 Tax=Enterococcus mediterraneensis TaxID=2364791 RepID=UPI001F14A88A|nr:hypothetical protein [Enterococcus mediterraneensis]